jgi:rod shape determining protein RodA
LKEYQTERLTSFLNEGKDAERSGYNQDQSKIAIGTGGITGQGLFKGTQTTGNYVPEQHTDFIFTVVGEELGFVGGSVLLALFALIVWRTWRAARLANDLFGTLCCMGVLAMIVFQVFENVGMTMGIMPITGIPLPWMSYGGSSVIVSFACIGLVANIHMRRFS